LRPSGNPTSLASGFRRVALASPRVGAYSARVPLTLQQCLDGKRFGLVMSAGFFGFYGHAGFLKGLAAARLAPSAYAGTSAGGLIAAFAAAGMGADEIAEVLFHQRREDFWDLDALGLLLGAARGDHGPTGLLKGDRFQALLRKTLPVRTFEECPHPLLVSAANLTTARTTCFTSGELAPRVHATCAYPGLFRAVDLDGALYWDGGLVDKAPALALAESDAGKGLEALLVHYLPSRVAANLGGPLAYVRGMDAGMAGLRHDHFKLQLRALEAKLPVYVVESNLPPVSPTTMNRGPAAAEAARASILQALAREPVAFDT
jgi:NTE family protein